MGVSNFAVYMAYCTFPHGKESKFIEAKRKTFDQYIKKNSDYLVENRAIEEAYYKPLIFHLFGSFDVVFISLIDNYKFCQKVFDIGESEDQISANYQIITGYYDKNYLPKGGENCLKGYFPIDNKKTNKVSKHKYVHITNFKLNNGLLLGNGDQFVDEVLKHIHSALNEYELDFLLFRSFNWSEITLIQFGDDLKELQRKIIDFRELSLSELANNVENISRDSLYHDLFTTNGEKKIDHSHVFVDSHSYSGVDYFEFNKKYDNKDNPYKDDMFKSSIELQVKPGHLNPLYNILKKNSVFDESKLKFKNGKTDYLVKEKEYESFISNYNLNRFYHHNGDELAQHIRKLKTNYLFDINELNIESKEVSDLGITNFGEVLSEKCTIDISGIKEKLKKLGISRQLREKILKAFYNFNNLITDIVLYAEFIELKDYLLYLERDINNEINSLDSFFLNPVKIAGANINDKNTFGVRRIEEKWKTILEIYEEAYHNRVHNNYLYEDINEFSIDFNCAVNQINTIHDFMVKTVNNFFFPRFKDQIIVTQNAIDTKSNVLNVNYNVYHFLEPSLIFTTLFKEVINGFEQRASKPEKNEKGELVSVPLYNKTNHFNTLKRKVYEDIGQKLNENETQRVHFDNFDFFYFFADIAKLGFTFLFDYQLYEYWSWTYFLQDSSHYQNNGLPDEGLFQKELLRISLIKRFFNDEDENLVQSPVPELFDLWQESIEDIHELAKQIIDCNHFKEDIRLFSEYIFIDKFKMDNSNYQVAVGTMELEMRNKLPDQHGKINKGEMKLLTGLKKPFPDNNYPVPDAYLQLKLINWSSLYIQSEDGKNGYRGELTKLFKLEKGALYLICSMSHATLSLFKEKGGAIKLLRRDCKKGKPLPDFTCKEGASLFIDPFGGFFHNSEDLKNEYFALKNNIISILWHFAMIDKKRLFTKKQKNETDTLA
ncbi:hypothetical protein [Aquimarina megaterium]|uniref:hypothetical protein n=1 Tax=Aquimarina megaterium TaxID=1443666 RepID=UPI0004718F96|nr:hypothetical protein [Aquimarina megaterium]